MGLVSAVWSQLAGGHHVVTTKPARYGAAIVAHSAASGQSRWRPRTPARADPREHGRQAARSKRDRPERAREPLYQVSHVRAAVGGVLKSYKAKFGNNAT